MLKADAAAVAGVITSVFSSNLPARSPEEVARRAPAPRQGGSAQFRDAQGMPLARQTGRGQQAAAGAGTVTRSSTVTTGPITIQTRATDADGISRAIGQSLKTHMANTQSGFDDGVAG